MNKKELIKELSDEMGMSKTQTEVLFEEMFACFSTLLKNGDSFSIPRFGKFEVNRVEGRTARNPKTGESIEVSPKNRVKFKASGKLKEIINEE